MIPYIDSAEIRQLLPVKDAIDELDAAWRTGMPQFTPRQYVSVDHGDLLLMPAWGDAGVGVKLITANPMNPAAGLPFIHGVYVLFDPTTLAPSALIDGAALTEVRTAAVSGLATRYLARPDSSHLVVFGTGVQARSHIDAMFSEREIERLTVVAKNPAAAKELASEVTAVEVVIAGPTIVGEADIVCLCTTSSTPVFDGADLAAGAHINAIGSHAPDKREVDTATVERSKVVVETREAALAEAGDLLIPIEEGRIAGSDFVDLQEVVSGRVVRSQADDVTLFKSVGIASEDLVVAAALARRIA